MRIELAGSLVIPQPLVINYFLPYQTFSPSYYIDLGYTNYDVICIGGGGGNGGGIDTANLGTLIRSYGGAGGGGGIHRVQGLLSALPAITPVYVGSGGDHGEDHSFDPAQTTDGADGGPSSFNETTCRASGGTGGKRVQSNSTTSQTLADGGEGGIGDSTTAGGGGAGGVAGTPADPGPGTPGTDGVDGSWDGTIGSGGGGGAGGVGKYGAGGSTLNAATRGGKGAYNPGNLSVYSPGGVPGLDPASGALDVVPGFGGGAKGAPLNGSSELFGRSGANGLVVVRLTAE